MSTTVTSIRGRLRKLQSITSAKLAVQNATEMYVQDVDALLVIVWSLRDAMARLTQTVQQGKAGECESLEAIKKRIDHQIEAVLLKRFEPVLGVPKSPELKVNG